MGHFGRSGARNIRISFSAGRLSHFGGIYLFHQFLQKLQMRTYLSRRLPYDQKNNRYSTTEMLFALIYPMILGLEKIEVSALLKMNGVFQYITGLPSFPDPQTLRRFLVRSPSDLLPLLFEVHDDLRKYFITRPAQRTTYWLDFDSTVNTIYGHQEGALKGYNPEHPGKRSYHPLVTTEAHLKDCLGGFPRYGNAYTSEGCVPLLQKTLSLISQARELRARADSGFYEKNFVAELDAKGILFAVVAKMTAPVKRRVASLRYRVEHGIFSTAEFSYQPHGWKRPYRFVVLRRKVESDPDENLTLFTIAKYAYSVIVTNLDLTPYGVFTFYKNRAGLERIIRIMKNDFPFGSAPTGSFPANALYTELSLLAYNVIIWFKRFCLPENWQSLTLSSLRHRLFLMPGEFVRTDNIPTLKFPRHHLYREVFEATLAKIKKMDPLV